MTLVITSLLCSVSRANPSLCLTPDEVSCQNKRFHCQALYSDTPLIPFWRQKTTRQLFAVPSWRSYPSQQIASASQILFTLGRLSGPGTKFQCQLWADGCIYWLPDKKWKVLTGFIPTQTPETGWDREWCTRIKSAAEKAFITATVKSYFMLDRIYRWDMSSFYFL